MTTHLGEFKGLPITGHSMSLKNAGDGLSKAMAVTPTDIEPGEELDLLVRVKAGNVAMKIDDIDHPRGWTLEQSLSAQTITIVDRAFAEDRIGKQREAEARIKEEDERRRGIHKLPGTGVIDKGPKLIADASGIVLTDAEVAEMRGQGLPVFEAKPCVVVYSDESRAVWPDEFEKGAPANDDFTDDDDPADLTATAFTEAPDDSFYDAADDPTGDLPDQAHRDWISVSIDELRKRVAGNLSVDWLRRALRAEKESPNLPRSTAVKVLEARITELGGS